ncbi:MAG: glycosyltransferase family 39 protein [Lachnospiraceae bacterium]|nr:glycosyltransferase family 39 protein [Lachnospiraceae bacterium]
MRIQIDFKKNYKIYLYFGIIFIVFMFTRLYCITSIPNGMHIDEVSMGYNVWSLSEFGTDRYNVSYPVYFSNAGSGQSSLYVYTAVLLAKLFGYSLLTLRLPAVLFGILLLVFGTKTAYEISGMRCAAFTAFFITTLPFFIMSERWAFDCNAMLPMFVMAFYFFIKLLKTNKTKYAFFAGIGFALTLYSYILAFIVVPVFLCIAVIYCLAFHKLSYKNLGIAAISGLICALPILLYILVIIGILPEFQIGPVSVTAASAERMSELAWAGQSISDIWQNLKLLTTYDNYSFTANDKYGVGYMNGIYILGFKLYVFPILLLAAFAVLTVVHIYRIIKHKAFCYELLMVCYIISGLAPMLFLEQFAIYRYNAVFFGLVYALAYLFDLLWQHKVRVVCYLFFALSVYNFGSYTVYVFSGAFSADYQALAYFDQDLMDICEKTDFGAYDAVYIDDTATYNTGLIVSYAMRITPEDAADEIQNIDTRNMIVRNVHMGIPDEIDPDENALYLIRDINADTSFYTTTYEQTRLWESLVHNNEIREMLMEAGSDYVIDNNYYLIESTPR